MPALFFFGFFALKAIMGMKGKKTKTINNEGDVPQQSQNQIYQANKKKRLTHPVRAI